MKTLVSLTCRGGFRVSARTVALCLAIALFVTLCALPTAWMLCVSFVDSDGGFTVGKQQRVAIARAIIAHPSLLLLDEPMSSLDAELKNDLIAELKSLQSALDATTVYITHDRIEAMTMACRVALMKNGKVTQIAATHESRGGTAVGEQAFD